MDSGLATLRRRPGMTELMHCARLDPSKRLYGLIDYPIASTLPATGMAGAVLLSVMTISYLLPSLTRHWPPTSGVLATFLAAKGGRFAPFHATLPTTVSRLVAAIAASVALASPACGVRLSTSIATSNSAWTNPIGWVHCLRVAPS